MIIKDAEVVLIDYTNYRGERSLRKIVPLGIRFDATEWHPEQQWLLDAYDLDRVAQRTFSVKNIHSWRPLDNERLTNGINKIP